MGKARQKHYKMKRMARRKRMLAPPFELNLTSMIDMFTIILVFLIKSYTVSDVAMSPPKDIKLPYSTSKKLASVAVKVSVSRDVIAVDDQPIVNLIEGRLQEQDIQALVIFPLYRELKAVGDRFKEQAAASPEAKPFDPKLVLHADKTIPFDTLKRILFTAGQAQFEAFRFSVLKKGAS